MIKPIYDLPVYRLSPEAYEEKRDRFIDNQMEEVGRTVGWLEGSQARQTFYDHLWRAYGGAWQFNEIIGYIRLRFFGNQIRGEWWKVGAKRISRTRKKQFEYRHWKVAPERHIPAAATNAEIYRIVLEYVDACRRERELSGRFVDTTLLEAVGPHVDWRGYLGTEV